MQWADLQRIIAEEVARRSREGGRARATATLCCMTAARIACAASSMPVRRGSVSTPARRSRRTSPRSSITRFSRRTRRGRRSRSSATKRANSASRPCASTRHWVSLAASLLRGAATGVCTVVGFPLGATTTDVKQYETRRVIYDGATEVDMVINVGALKSGDLAWWNATSTPWSRPVGTAAC